MTQAMILFLGLAAIAMTQLNNATLHRYACFPGLASQPFFLWETYIHGQWGMFALAIAYTFAWLIGLWNYWFR